MGNRGVPNEEIDTREAGNSYCLMPTNTVLITFLYAARTKV
jgi:hypothetical protein